ncbi:MAG TPA: hypothetical protein GX530_04460 [Corynebacteriales bacterium]|nr:hypothetical protein [Mycobacteriales bacterium]
MSVFTGRKQTTHRDPYEEKAEKILEALDLNEPIEITDEVIEDIDQVLLGIQELVDNGFLSVEDLKVSSRPENKNSTKPRRWD